MNLLKNTNLHMDKLAVIIINLLLSTHLCVASEDTLYLQKDDFSVVKDDYLQLFIQIKDSSVIDQINTTPDLTICFKVENRNYTAAGTYWFESSTPAGCNCIFLKSTQSNFAVMHHDTLTLVKTPPDKKLKKLWKQVYQKYKQALYFQYEKRYQDHNFIFLPDGTFVEYQWYRKYKDVPCEKGWIISRGKYEKKRRYYILNSYPTDDWSVKDTANLNDVKTSHIPQDSLHIIIKSPYTQLLLAEDTCGDCNYKHQHIYSFDYIIECGNDELNKEYESAFNSKYVSDTTGEIKVHKPQNIQIKSILVKISWNIHHKDTVIMQTTGPDRCFKYDFENVMDNIVYININSLDYAFLSRSTYVNHKLRRKGRKILVVQNQVFKRL